MNPITRLASKCLHRPSPISLAPAISARGLRFGATSAFAESGSPAQSNLLDQIADVSKRKRFRSVYDALNLDSRMRMPYDEFIHLCSLNGLQKDEPKELVDSLHTAGLIWYYPGSFEAKEPLVLKPREATKAWENILDSSNQRTDAFIKERVARLKQLLLEIAPLEKQHDEIEKRSAKHAHRMWGIFGGYVVFHIILVPYLTFWKLSWDIMEPVTYMFNLWTLGIATWFYFRTNRDFSTDAITEVMVNSKRQRMYRRMNFDADTYNKLRREIAEVTDDLVNPEWAMLKEVHPRMPDYCVYDKYDNIDDLITELEDNLNLNLTSFLEGTEKEENKEPKEASAKAGRE